MKKIYIFSFLGGLLLGLGGLWFGAVSNVLGGVYNSLPGGSLLFLIWLSLLLKKILHLDKKKHHTVLLVGLLGFSITASLFIYGVTHITISLG